MIRYFVWLLNGVKMIELLKKRAAHLKGVLTARLANKMILVLSPLVTVFFIMLVLISYFRTTEILTNDFIENNNSILKLISRNFENYMEQVDEFSLTLRMDVAGKFMKLLPLEDYSYENENYIDEQVVNMFNARQDIEELRLYIPASRHDMYISRSYPKINVNHFADLSEEEWYKKSIVGKYYRFIEPAETMNGNQAATNRKKVFFTFHRALINIPDQKPLGVVSITFNHNQINKMIRSEYTQNGEILCLYDRNDQPIYSTDMKAVDPAYLKGLFEGKPGNGFSGSMKVKIDKQDYLAVYAASDNLEWKAVKLIPIDMINKKVRETRNISFLIGLIFILLFVTLIIFLSNLITGSLRRLSKQMDKVGHGNFKVKAAVTGNDEIAHLAQKFNFMVEQIDGLVNEKYMAQISEKTARLKALEAQINPHFLYNSLQAISSKAVMGGMKDISRMIEAMAYNLRYCIKGGDMVLVSNEIEHIENYLILHKARFEDRLTVEILVEEGMPDIVIPKLSIHTLVENSIKHCLEMMTESILIKIHTYAENGHIIVSVTDDGPGMTPERLQQVLKEIDDPRWLEKPEESIGLKNLNARLKLLYGSEASLAIDSGQGRGTEIKIVLPAKQLEYGEQLT